MDDPEQPRPECDWATLWQSELAALAVDPEALERAAAFGRALADAAGGAGADAPAGAAPAAPASELVRELEALRRRVAELERAARA